MKELKTAGVRLPDSPLVPYPSRSLVPERDVRYAPVLEASRLGIDFGGLTAVDDFTLTIGRTEIAGLIGPNGAGKTTVFNLLTSVYQHPGQHPHQWDANGGQVHPSGQPHGHRPYLPEYPAVQRYERHRQCEGGDAQ